MKFKVHSVDISEGKARVHIVVDYGLETREAPQPGDLAHAKELTTLVLWMRGSDRPAADEALRAAASPEMYFTPADLPALAAKLKKYPPDVAAILKAATDRLNETYVDTIKLLQKWAEDNKAVQR